MNIIVLDAASKSITARIEGAHTTTAPSFVSAYADATASAFTEGANNGVLNGATEVAIVAAPAASTRRMIREMTFYNADTVAHTLTISLLVTATYTIIRKVAVGVGGTYVFSDDVSSFDMAATINTATAKTTPVDADRFVFWDSVSGLLNHVTWANIKATLAAVFAPIAHSNASAAVHGLPASVNVLGNRNAAGEFVQRGGGDGTTTGTDAFPVQYYNYFSVTFPVAFTTLQAIVISPNNKSLTAAGIYAKSTTGASANVVSYYYSTAIACDWIAIGA